jgi:hypothetical protein
MTGLSIVLGSPGWMTVALAAAGVAGVALLWSYTRAGANRGVRSWCGLLKGLALALLATSLLEPLLSGSRPRPGANAFVILADNSQSLQIRDGRDQPSRGDWLRGLLTGESAWKTRLGQDFDVRPYAFDSHLRAVNGFETLNFDGTSSSLSASLAALAKRFRGLPLAGVMLVSDGNATDEGDIDWSSLPPVYPVVPPSQGVARDISVRQVTTSQTNFESAPVVIAAEVSAAGYEGRPVVAVLSDEAGKEVGRKELTAAAGDRPLGFRFQFRPPHKGVNFYRVSAFAAGEEIKPGSVQDASSSNEQTLANNSRQVVIDQGSGPYRVLYVSGRPNWEFKFLKRAVAEDEQIRLVGLVRIARRQPKFDFRSARSQSTSPLFDGFDHPDPETAETADQPVLVRLDTEDEVELRDGFPKTAEDLYRYHAVVFDDLEAGFFTPDQLALVRNFVSQRGGGLLMLGGPDAFSEGKYDRTPVGELLPVYLTPAGPPPDGPAASYQLVLTREGWLQPWVRLRATEEEELRRIASMGSFNTLSGVGKIKPGAAMLAQVRDPSGGELPALVAQQFGKGHVGAILIGDLWRWGMRREDPAESDLEKSWRQTVRWLVGDVPGRVDVSAAPNGDALTPAVDLAVRVRDATYRPLDNAKVSFDVKLPSGEELSLDAAPDSRENGMYSARYVPKQPGAYRALAAASAPDGSPVGEREAGWVAQPAADEFARLEPNRDFLKNIAARTGGEVIEGKDMDSFVASLPSRKVPITEPWTSPLWHHPLYFLLAIILLLAEWGLRRVNGLP